MLKSIENNRKRYKEAVDILIRNVQKKKKKKTKKKGKGVINKN